MGRLEQGPTLASVHRSKRTREQPLDGRSDQSTALVPEDSVGFGIREQNIAVVADEDNRVRRSSEQVAEHRLTLMERHFGAAPVLGFRKVLANDQHGLGAVELDERSRHFHGNTNPVVADPGGPVERERLSLNKGGSTSSDPLMMFRRDDLERDPSDEPLPTVAEQGDHRRVDVGPPVVVATVDPHRERHGVNYPVERIAHRSTRILRQLTTSRIPPRHPIRRHGSPRWAPA